ncbi:LPXTG cell wall anchor domain-containing protein [Faecalicoccus pleomorphus]|uniref:LPXTG cell wall anchor domain-containing protein n=1 Tax=Faecalicoccus pleomorphus TaxID=1323 RepID=UPI001960F7CD|nr:LPXTG cell wall anchor domain-containing protein [Faecalicoccus pleomorphus]MBM6678264.1 LPXTG cell wall anchor domain-containing protein [Faecalicoccus pleomorphus]
MRRGIWNKVLSMLTALLLVIGIAPMTATTTFAAEGTELYISGQLITESGCYENQNGTWTKVDGTEPASGQFYYDAATFTLTLNEVEISHNQNVSVGSGAYYRSSVIAFSRSADVSLNIVVSQGTSTITGTGGIRVMSEAGDASLSISGSGSLAVNVGGNIDSGITLIGSKDANLNIDGADVTASSNVYGVQLSAGEGYKIAATVNNGNLTATGSTVGIYFMRLYNDGPSSLTVSGNAMVDTEGSTGGIINGSPDSFQIGADGESGGIVFNGKSGTVYGNVTLQDSLTINEGETLTIPQGSSLNTNGNLINNGTIVSAPTITAQPISQTVEEGNPATFTITASGSNLQYLWQKSADNGISWIEADGAATEATYTTEAATTGMNGLQYRCVVWNSLGKITSNAAILTVKHSLTHYEYKAPTCTENGNKEYWYCESCKQYFSDENATMSTTKEDTVIPATEHAYGEPTWEWSKNGQSATATFICDNDENHQESKEASITSTVKEEPTCTEDGITVYTATVEFNGQTYTDTKDVADIPATGHSYGEPVWSWAEDGKTCKVTFTCEKDETHKETPVVTVTSAEKAPATCTEAGVTTYTATVEFNGKTYTDTKDVADIPATGHSYGKPVWSWSEDGKTCTVTFTCEKDENHKESPKVTVTSAEKTPGTCTEKGVTTYTATVEFNGKTYTDTKDLTDIPAIGHKLTKTEVKTPTSTDTGNIEYWYCEVCDKYFSDEKAEHEITLEDTIIAKLPQLISGANQEWTKGSKDGLTFKVDTDINEFKKVLVDGKELKDTNYDIKSGSTILTLKSSFLDTLSAGKHQICLEFNNGTIEAYFTVKVKETTTVPETGEQTNLYLWAMLAIASSASLLVLRRYKKYNR